MSGVLEVLAAGKGYEIVQVKDRYARRYFLVPLEGDLAERVGKALKFRTQDELRYALGLRKKSGTCRTRTDPSTVQENSR